MLRNHQLSYQIKAAVVRGPSTWRWESVSAGRSNELLQKRNRQALSVGVPHASTGIEAGDMVVFVPAASEACPMATCPQADAAAVSSANQQPAKRTRMSLAASPRPVVSAFAQLASTPEAVELPGTPSASGIMLTLQRTSSGLGSSLGSPLAALFHKIASGMRSILSPKAGRSQAVSGC